MEAEGSLFTPISCTGAASGPSGLAAFGAAIVSSFQDTGFAVLVDTPIPAEVISGAAAASTEFFALDEEAKMAFHDPAGAGQRGYTPFGLEHAKQNDKSTRDIKEFFHVGRNMDRTELTASPEWERDAALVERVMKATPSVGAVDGFDAATYALYEALDEFGRGTVLEAIAVALGLGEGYFSAGTQEGNSILRLLHYPPQEEVPPEGSIRAAAHEDISVITLLLGADEAGLQVLHRSGVWLDISPPPGALVINCGDTLQRLTGGILPSTTHRVINPVPERAMKPRYSCPFFLHFAPDYLITPIPGATNPQPPVLADDYLMQRLAAIGLVNHDDAPETDNPATATATATD